MPGILGAQLVDGVGGEAAVHRAVAAPQDHLRVAQLLGGQPAVGLARVPDDAVVERQPHLEHGGVAAQVLVGEEEAPSCPRRAAAKAHSSAASALDDVQTAPPLRPQNALMSAEEFM